MDSGYCGPHWFPDKIFNNKTDIIRAFILPYWIYYAGKIYAITNKKVNE